MFTRVGNQRVAGRIDLLLEADDGFIVIDHKTFPGPADTWAEKAEEFAPQLSLYARMVAQATGKKVSTSFVHMPIVGVMIGIASR